MEQAGLHLAPAGASTHHTHLHGPHQLFCWSSPKRARHFLGALRSDAATGRRSQQTEGERERERWNRTKKKTHKEQKLKKKEEERNEEKKNR